MKQTLKRGLTRGMVIAAGILAAAMFVAAAAITPTTVLVVLVAILAFLTFGAYIVMAPWWTTRAGRALFALLAALVILCAHFIMEAAIGQSPQEVENVVIALVGAALGFNLWTILYKQWHFRGQDKP